jgi:putative flippase GtrA
VKRFASFLVAGGAGFVADAGALLVLLAWTPLGPLAGRAVSIAFALLVTWTLNRTITFGPSARHIAVEGTRYGAVGVSSAMVNYALYAAALALAPSLPPMAALVLASAGALAWSYLGYSRFVFDR